MRTVTKDLFSREGCAFIDMIDKDVFCSGCPMIRTIPATWVNPPEDWCPCDFDITDERCYRYKDVIEMLEHINDAKEIIEERG